MKNGSFDDFFVRLTGNSPFPWQQALFQEFVDNRFPSSCNLPTGLGKTSVIPIWFLALSCSPSGVVPRRLVYVVNRRTVVDQATDEARKIRERLIQLNDKSLPPLAISTLRGQFADNREWLTDPSQPAVIVGTVDMIGSRLLFEGYGCGYRTRPLHAGFLGQDVLLVHDEAHLEPNFQSLLKAIEHAQDQEEHSAHLPWSKLRVMELTATPRGNDKPFELTEEERNPPTQWPNPPKKPIHHVWQRLQARKGIRFTGVLRKEVPETIGRLALRFKDQGKAILIYVRTIDNVNAVRSTLTNTKTGVPEDQVAVLTGTIRGLERDQLVDDKKVFSRFLRKSNDSLSDQDTDQTVYLICTSAGEVGIDLSADHMICDLSTLDSMAQRLGRVNRRGDGAAEIDVVYETDPNPKLQDSPYEKARWKTLSALLSLPECNWIEERHEASPREIGNLTKEWQSAFAPTSAPLAVDDILFDAWALTTIRGRLPGRPPVEDWLHGVSEQDAPETYVAWRKEVCIFSPPYPSAEYGSICERLAPTLADLFDDFPLKPHELLRDRTTRIQESLAVLAKDHENAPVWIIEPNETVRILTLAELTQNEKKGSEIPLAGRTVVLPPCVGGLTPSGTLDGRASFDHSGAIQYDVAGHPSQPSKAGSTPNRPSFVRLIGEHHQPESDEGSMTYTLLGPTIDLAPDFAVCVKDSQKADEVIQTAFLGTKYDPMRVAFRMDVAPHDRKQERPNDYVILKRVLIKNSGSECEPEWPSLETHQVNVGQLLKNICERLSLSTAEMARAIAFAGRFHDLGKYRRVWQEGAGNTPDLDSDMVPVPVAKPVHGLAPENLNGFRHEFASLIDIQSSPALLAEFETFSPDMQDLILHLIAVHHGRGRPHFPGLDDADLRQPAWRKTARKRPSRPENIDPERPTTVSVQVGAEVLARYARLQRKYGRWGLAYLESLLRAADALDSRRIEETPIGEPEQVQPSDEKPSYSWRSVVKTPKAVVRLLMEPTNPGEFFACCGLLELAHRVWKGAEGWFEGEEFCLRPVESHEVRSVCPVGLVDALARCLLTNNMGATEVARLTELSRMSRKERAKDPRLEDEKKALESQRREAPILLHDPINLRIDWFLDTRAGGSRFKTWAGQQSVIDIAAGMHGALSQASWDEIPPSEWLSQSIPVDSLPFQFDSDLSGQGAAIDAGFSFDPLGLKMPSRPLLELAAFVGLQRFRPLPVPNENLYRFNLWTTPLLPSVAAPAACGAVATPGASRYEFRLLYRTKYLKSFLPAQPYQGEAR